MFRHLLLLAAILVAAPAVAGDDNICGDQRICVNVTNQNFAVGVNDDEMSLSKIEALSPTLERTNGNLDKASIDSLYNILNADNARVYMGLIKPTPTMHSVNFEWKLGLALKSGETVWAVKWFIPSSGKSRILENGRSIDFVPGIQGLSPHRKAFIVYLIFPKKTPSGQDWKIGKVSGLVIE